MEKYKRDGQRNAPPVVHTLAPEFACYFFCQYLLVTSQYRGKENTGAIYFCLMLKYHFSLIVIAFKAGNIFGVQCEISAELRDHGSCKAFWDCTAEDLLRPMNKSVSRQDFGRLHIEEIGHTPMWLRVVSHKLHCVVHPDFQIERYRLKIYRAAHYINRLNRILREGKLKVAEGTEWWTHHSDWVKVPAGRTIPPVFSVSGAAGYADIAGIPFMSFSDKVSYLENIAFRRLEEKLRGTWENRKEVAFFRGSLSDCADAVNMHAGDVKFCARAKVIQHSKETKNPLLLSLSTTSNFKQVGLSDSCPVCTSRGGRGESFVRELLTNKYLLDFAGAGNWSRRMSLLLRSGGLVFKSESLGYQFYEFNLKPGVHYVPFDPQIGITGTGNLLSRLEWAQNNDETAKRIARTSQSFGRFCLTESSIDEFLSLLLMKYSQRLRDDPLPYPLIDLSSCFSEVKGYYYKLSKYCEETIKRCWAT